MAEDDTSVSKFLASHGFTADPFELTSSDSEPLLDRYFVPPPFFSAVLGDPKNPRPAAVFAPRGTGKTALRLAVEAKSRANRDFLCITYDQFGIKSKAHLESIDLNYHLGQLLVRLTMAALAHLEKHEGSISALNKHQRQVVVYCSRTFLGDLTQLQYSQALASVKTLYDKGVDVWAKYGGLVATVLTAILKKIGIEDVSIPAELRDTMKREDSLQYLFAQLLEISRVLGYKSVYFLVDRVDELSQTSQDRAASWRLVRDMLVDLPFLESRGAGFKFFLWEPLHDSFRDDGGRPDRVLVHELNWTTDELRVILRKRLEAYSDGRVTDISSMLDNDCVDIDLETLVVYLAAGSPRDLVRICKAIVDEATRTGSDGELVKRAQLLAAIRSFCRQYAETACGSRLAELRKIGTVTFTINQLASGVFNISENAARSKVQKWQDSGLVEKVDERANRVNRPLHVYSISDPRVAVACSESLELELILDNYLLICGRCGSLEIAGDAEFRCTGCDQVQVSKTVDSLWAIATTRTQAQADPA